MDELTQARSARRGGKVLLLKLFSPYLLVFLA